MTLHVDIAKTEIELHYKYQIGVPKKVKQLKYRFHLTHKKSPYSITNLLYLACTMMIKAKK